ncbi:MAG: hypothetical protein EBQ92_09935 [Proteobacteria bacterium]|nr:hypothetical protein [Pseudomonadota bacterium]
MWNFYLNFAGIVSALNLRIFKLILFLCWGFYFSAFASENQLPFSKDELVLSSESAKTIRFLKNTKIEIDLIGKIKKPYDLYLNGELVPNKQGQFKAKVTLDPVGEGYYFKIRRPGVSETVYPFKIKFVKEVPLPLRVKIEGQKTKPISLEKVFTGTFPAKDWIQFSWAEPTEKVDPAYLEKIEREKQELARLEEERIQREKEDQERALELKEEMARLEAERIERVKAEHERMLEMQEKFARLEQERLEKEKREKEQIEEQKKEQARLEKERLEEEREAKEKEKEKEKEREVASQMEKSNEMIEQRQYREPIGLNINQGLGAFSLNQTDVNLSSLNWMVDVSYQKKITERMTVGGYGKSYIVPLSVSGATKGPNVIKAGADLSYELKDASGTRWIPVLGFGYQTVVTSEPLGYRDLFGPKLGLAVDVPVGPLQSLRSSVSMSFFPATGQIIAFGNKEIHFKTALQWKVASSFLSSFSLGADFSSLNLSISGTKLTSSGYSVFFGLNF